MCENSKKSPLGQEPNKYSRIHGMQFFDKISDAIDKRCEFAKDKDRIIFSKAFRRLGHKTQIYTHSKGDHYRTRLTHTLEVAQIAQSIAKRLERFAINIELCTAIAYGHDIGHTPFGHEGERALNDIMTGRDTLGGVIKQQFNHGGFKHNFNSLRVLSKVEKKYPRRAGMNLTWETMEGILKHTSFRSKTSNNKDAWRIKEYLDSYETYFVDSDNLLEHDYPVTLEGQIVAIADEIAQRQHDLDDGFMDNSLNIQLPEFVRDLVDELERVDEKIKLRNIYGPMQKDLKKIKDYLDDKKADLEIAQDLIIRWLLNYLIYDITSHSENLLKSGNLEIFEFKDKKCFAKKYIEFSELGKAINVYCENYIRTEIVNSYEVNSQDEKAIYVIRRLFKAFHNNPRQMPKYVLENIYNNVRELSQKYNNPDFISRYIQADSLRRIKKQDLNKLIAILRLDADSFDNEYFAKNTSDESNDNFPKEIKDLFAAYKTIVDPDSLTNDTDRFIYEMNHCYLFEICDYISGMTDNYCASEYKKLFQVD